MATPTNKELIDLAYMGLAISDAMFGRTPEEYAAGAKLLRAMMAEWPFDQIEYVDEGDATPSVAAESGIDRKWTQAVALSLAERIGAAIGKSLQPEARKALARSYSRLCSGVAVVTDVSYADATLTGSGRRSLWGGRRTWFPAA